MKWKTVELQQIYMQNLCKLSLYTRCFTVFTQTMINLQEYLINCQISLKCFEFRIGISSATTGKNFIKIGHHLSEL